MHGETLELREVMVFLVAAGVVVPLIQRLGIGSVLGFLAVGLVIGPFGLARFAGDLPWLGYAVIADLEGVRALAELGVVFLLFMIGLELSLERLWAMRRAVFGLGGAQVVVTGAVITGIASTFDNTLAAAVVLGAGFALSSTAIVMQLLADNRRLGTATGQTTFAVLLFQDLAVLPILFMVGALAERGGGGIAFAFAQALGQAALAVALILLVGLAVVRPLFRFVGSSASREMFLASVLLVIIGTSIATEQAGLSMALGAFLAGLVFAETEYRHAIEVDIEPFKGLLLGLFFVSVGMGIDNVQVASAPVWLAASVVGLFVIKGTIFYTLARLAGRRRPVALESALLLGQGGEFAFLVVGLALALGLMPYDTVQFMLIVTGLTMVVTPLVAQVARRLALMVESREASDGDDERDLPTGLSGHVVIAGYGRVGQMLGTVLDAQELPYLALDTNSALVGQFRRQGAGIFFGDARRPDILKKAQAGRAGALVVTMDSPLAAARVVEVARQHWPDLKIYARARDAVHARRLLDHGATHVIPETVEASLQLSEMVLTGAGIPDGAARHLVEVRRQAEQAALDQHRETMERAGPSPSSTVERKPP
jgi:monovalent cation:proton antiporter-2 (CPA2) family protein